MKVILNGSAWLWHCMMSVLPMKKFISICRCGRLVNRPKNGTGPCPARNDYILFSDGTGRLWTTAYGTRKRQYEYGKWQGIFNPCCFAVPAIHWLFMQFKCDCLHQQSGRKRIIRVKNAVEGGKQKSKTGKMWEKIQGRNQGGTSRIKLLSDGGKRRKYYTAASILHVTQPTLSRQLIQLEEELGVRLFDSSSHNIVLTEDGRDRAEAGRTFGSGLKKVLDKWVRAW